MRYDTEILTVNYLRDDKTYWGSQLGMEHIECAIEAWQNKEVEDYMERGFVEQADTFSKEH